MEQYYAFEESPRYSDDDSFVHQKDQALSKWLDELSDWVASNATDLGWDEDNEVVEVLADYFATSQTFTLRRFQRFDCAGNAI